MATSLEKFNAVSIPSISFDYNDASNRETHNKSNSHTLNNKLDRRTKWNPELGRDRLIAISSFSDVRCLQTEIHVVNQGDLIATK